MDLRRLRAGEWITAVAGVVLLASLFLPWYADAGDAASTASGFEALSVIDLLLALIALAAVALLLVTAGQRLPAVPVAMSVFVAYGGLLATLLVLFRWLDLPGDAASREWGLWPALAASLGIAAGALVAMRDERLSAPGRHTDLSGRPTPPPPELETLPARRPGGAG